MMLKRIAVMCCLAALLSGCSTRLFTSLSEIEANEVVAALSSAGIYSSKERVDDKRWAVDVSQSELPNALATLRQQGLPRERFGNLGDLFKKEGLMSTPTEERVRYLHGVSQQLSETISLLDGVMTSRVHIVIPPADPLSDKVKPSSASVFVKHRNDVNLEMIAPAIRTLVLRSVEGLNYENISISFFPAEVAPRPDPLRMLNVYGVDVPAKSMAAVRSAVLIPSITLLTLLILLLIRYRRHLADDWVLIRLWFKRLFSRPERSSGDASGR
jgi:type III secretion protein J